MNRLRCGSKPKSACRALQKRVLLRVAVVVGADQSVEIGRQFDPFQLQRQRVAVRVGEQRHALAGPAQGGEEGIGVRTQRDQVRHLVLEFADRQVQFPAPEIQAVPVELAGVFAEQRLEHGVGFGATEAIAFGIALGQVFQPEVVVEVQVEQGAVHVEQHGVDGGPGQGGHGGSCRGSSRSMRKSVASHQSPTGIIGKAGV